MFTIPKWSVYIIYILGLPWFTKLPKAPGEVDQYGAATTPRWTSHASVLAFMKGAAGMAVNLSYNAALEAVPIIARAHFFLEPMDKVRKCGIKPSMGTNSTTYIRIQYLIRSIPNIVAGQSPKW